MICVLGGPKWRPDDLMEKVYYKRTYCNPEISMRGTGRLLTGSNEATGAQGNQHEESRQWRTRESGEELRKLKDFEVLRGLMAREAGVTKQVKVDALSNNDNPITKTREKQKYEELKIG